MNPRTIEVCIDALVLDGLDVPHAQALARDLARELTRLMDESAARDLGWRDADVERVRARPLALGPDSLARAVHAAIVGSGARPGDGPAAGGGQA